LSFIEEFLAFLCALYLKMKRRELIKSIGLTAASTSILPNWLQGWSEQKLISSDIFDTNQKNQMASIAETFIPEGAEKGANGVGVGKFLDVLFADCLTTDDQNKIKDCLMEVDAMANQLFQQTFRQSTQQQREKVLVNLAINPMHKWAADTLRNETIRGYTTSEYVMVNYYHYVMAPGFYNGCVAV
jgi:predicted Ser/Thr protein kinase